MVITRADVLTVDAGTSRAYVSAETYVGDTVSIVPENLRCGYTPYTGDVDVSDGDAASIEGEVVGGMGWISLTAASEGEFTPVITFSDGICAGMSVTLAPYEVLTNDVTLDLNGPSDPVAEGDTYMMVATVTAVAGTRIPQGEVTFINDVGRFTAMLDSNGVATFDAVAPTFPASAGGSAAAASSAVVGSVPWGADFASTNGLTGVIFGPLHSIDVDVIAGARLPVTPIFTPTVTPTVAPKPPSSAPPAVPANRAGTSAVAFPDLVSPAVPSGATGRRGNGHSSNTGVSPKLARTGSSSGMLVSSGFGLVVAGAVLLVLRRRRGATVA